MTDLYVLLVSIGVLIIVAVFFYNWWQERQYYQQAEKNFTPLQSDALLDDPKLDVNKVADTFEDTIIDPFSTKLNLNQADLAADNQSNNMGDKAKEELLPDNLSINEAYKQLTQARAAALAYQKSADTSYKPRKEEIKAIFDDAFGHKNKSTTESQSAELPNKSEPKESQVPTAPPITAAPEINVKLAQITPSEVPLEKKLSLDSKPVDNSESTVQENNELALPAMLQPQMDYSIVLHLTRELPASTIVSTLIGKFEGYDKPVFVHTLTSNALELAQDVASLWTLLKEVSPHQKVSKVACSIQLADRSGAVSRNLLNRFQLAVNELSQQLNAQLINQEVGDVLSKANALDAFCIEVDKTIGFHLLHGDQGAFTGIKLKGLAESQGFRLDTDGSFKYFDEYGHLLFIMFNRENFRFNVEMLRNSVIKGVTFQLDIPHVSENGHAFNQMVNVAKQMSVGLNAVLVDEGNKLLGDAHIDKISQQLKAIHSNMLSHSIVPGSKSAIRLFS